MSIVNIISFIIFVISLEMLANLSTKLQALERPNKASQRYSNPDKNLMEN